MLDSAPATRTEVRGIRTRLIARGGSVDGRINSQSHCGLSNFDVRQFAVQIGLGLRAPAVPLRRDTRLIHADIDTMPAHEPRDQTDGQEAET